jgi:signal transduction histidine kinase
MAITIERLRRSDLFNELTDVELTQIAQLGHEEAYLEGDVILTEDAPAEKLFVIEQGKLSLEKKIQLGRRGSVRTATVGMVGPAKSAGWSALTPPHLYTSSAVCLEPTRAIAFESQALLRHLSDNPPVGYKVMTAIARLARARYKTATDTLAYFVSIVSHELRAPLAAIENYLNVMLDGFAGEISDKQRRMLERSALRVNDLRSLIGDIVDLARMRPEQIQADFEWFDPGEVGTESIEDVRLAAGERNVHIKVEPPPKFDKIIGARRRLRQVFTNLLTNAVKFSPPGGTVMFRAHYEPDALVFEVEDEGIGIPPQDQPHIFDDFFRADNAGEAPGSGLGLSIARKIMDAHEGKLLVTSPYVEGKTGTRFTVVIPRNLQTPEMRRDAQSDASTLARLSPIL